MIDNLMKEIGIEGGSLGRMTDVLRDAKDIASLTRRRRATARRRPRRTMMTTGITDGLQRPIDENRVPSHPLCPAGLGASHRLAPSFDPRGRLAGRFGFANRRYCRKRRRQRRCQSPP